MTRRHWDGTEDLPFVLNDGGRASAGRKGEAGDCVTRAIAIAADLPYLTVYERLAHGMGTQSRTKNSRRRAYSASHGVNTQRLWFKRYMQELGFRWVATMQIGSGCRVRLLKGELPTGRLVVRVSRHVVAVIDGVIHDTYDPSRTTMVTEGGTERLAHRCVYGYWVYEGR